MLQILLSDMLLFAGLLTGGTATEFEALQAALREAANTPTMDFSSTGMGLDATQDGK